MTNQTLNEEATVFADDKLIENNSTDGNGTATDGDSKSQLSINIITAVLIMLIVL